MTLHIKYTVGFSLPPQSMEIFLSRGAAAQQSLSGIHVGGDEELVDGFVVVVYNVASLALLLFSTPVLGSRSLP